MEEVDIRYFKVRELAIPKSRKYAVQIEPSASKRP